MRENPQSGDMVFDLLRNEEFVLWVTNPREESDHYWSKWITANPERRKDVELARQFILSSKKKVDEKIPEAGYDYILEKIFIHGQKDKPKQVQIWKPLSIAASIAIIMMVSIYLTLDGLSNKKDDNLASITTIQKEIPFGKKITTRLPDGSTVILNSGSKIIFPEQFTGDLREVSLIGEGFFEVKRNSEKPFVVSMNGNKVRVLGTSFNIRSYPSDSVIQVSVATGKVSYSIPSGESVILNPDQGATHDLKKGSLVTNHIDRLQAFGWKDNVIYFRSVTFNQVLTELERWYGVDIIAHGNYQQIGRFSGEFRDETLSQVLNGLSFIYKFDFKIEGADVTLNKKI